MLNETLTEFIELPQEGKKVENCNRFSEFLYEGHSIVHNTELAKQENQHLRKPKHYQRG